MRTAIDRVALAVSALLLSLLIFTATSRGQTAPSTSFALPPGPLKVKISGVQGIVQARLAADQKWAKATEGMELSEGAELRTGPRSAVRFMIGDDQVVTLDRLGTIQILRANFENGKVFTDLGMKYGRTRYDIESAAREHDAKVRSPSSVLAVRGTQFSLLDQPPFAPQAVSLTGRVMFRDAHKLVAFGGKGQGKTVIKGDSNGAADTALKTSAASPTGSFAGASISEQERILEASYGGSLQNLGVASLFAQARLQNFAVVAAFDSGQLFISDNWNSFTTNVALSILTPPPFNEMLNAANPSVTSGGTFQANTGPNSFGVNQEAATWTRQFPPGKYAVTTALTNAGSVTVNLDATLLRQQGGQQGQAVHLVGVNGNSLPIVLNAQNPSRTIIIDTAAAPPSAAISIKRHGK